VRDADVARFVRQLYPEATEGPKLDRTRLVHRGGDATTSQVSGTELLALTADLDDFEEEFAKKRKRKTLAVALAAAVLVLGTLAVAGLALREGPAQPGSSSSTVDAPSE
jgi:hypothetical protein